MDYGNLKLAQTTPDWWQDLNPRPLGLNIFDGIMYKEIGDCKL